MEPVKGPSEHYRPSLGRMFIWGESWGEGIVHAWLVETFKLLDSLTGIPVSICYIGYIGRSSINP